MIKGRFVLLILFHFVVVTLWAQTRAAISNTESWKASDWLAYIEQALPFDTPFDVYDRSSNHIIVSQRCIYTPTNQTYPKSLSYNTILTASKFGAIRLNNISPYLRFMARVFGCNRKQ